MTDDKRESLFDLLNHSSFKLSILDVVVMFCILAVIIIPLERMVSGRRVRSSWHKGNLLNLVYWFFNPLFIRPFTNIFIAACLIGMSFLLGMADAPDILKGYGPIARQPVWIQIIEILLLADLIEYWVHRTFHKSRFWKIHAIHHSSPEMTWLASARMHPINDLCTKVCQVVPLVAAGFPIQSAALVIPFLFIYVVFLHSDISWKYGPFRYILVSPPYHHWHHSSEEEALDKNFAGIFPLWDILFGTYYFPDHRASRFGIIGKPPAENLLAQMTYPFK